MGSRSSKSSTWAQGLHDVGGPGIWIAPVQQRGDPVEVDALQRKAGQLAAVGQRHGGPQRRVPADHVDGVHRAGQGEVAPGPCRSAGPPR